MSICHTTIAVLLLATACGACGGLRERDAPVAAPSVTLSSDHVRLGRMVEATYRFAVAKEAPPFTDDYIVFVHVYDESGTQLWTDDHEPPTPTRLWKAGTSIEYTRPLFVPRRAGPGRLNVEIGLYSAKSGERLPLAGTSGGLRSYRVARLEAKWEPEPPAVFADGWHGVEATDDTPVEWRWSSGLSTVLCRNPKADSELLLQLDQPVSELSGAQHVEIRVGGSVIDDFQMAPGQRELRRVPVSAAVLGGEEIARIIVVVNPTFVPARLVPGSHDTRELGVRVFHALLNPH